jgi:hypothetical protein
MNRIVSAIIASFFITTVYVSGSDLVTFNKAALYDKSQPTMKVLKKGAKQKMAVSGPMFRMLRGAGYNY